jgi:hypothetical protein
MSRVWDLNLIRFFDFYLATTFLLSIAVRLRQYRTVLALLHSLPGRWPRLLELMKQHRSLLVTRETVAPAVLALLLMLAQGIASRVVWRGADLTLGRLFDYPLSLSFVAPFGLGMLAVDVYFIVAVAQFDRRAMEKQFDLAELCLRAAPFVRKVTFGYVNPLNIVAAEVRTTLADTSKLLNSTLWWTAAQAGLRIAYGLSIWVTFALTHPSA